MKRTRVLIMFLGMGLFFHTIYAQTWIPTKRITYNSGSSGHKSICVANNNRIHLVWNDDTSGNYEIFYRQSSNVGATWSPLKRLTYNSGSSEQPFVATDSSNNIHVLWKDDKWGQQEISYKKSTDGGITWSALKRLTYTTGWKGAPRMVIDSSDKLHVVWNEDKSGQADIIYKNSTNGGSTWSAPKRITFTSGLCSNQHITVDFGGAFYIVWTDDTPGNKEVFFKKSVDSGATWSASKRITYNPGAAAVTRIAADTNHNLFLFWNDDTPGNNEIYYKKSTDGGTTWSMLNRLTFSSGNSGQNCIAIDTGSIIHVAWSDDTTGNAEIYYKQSTNGGSTWSSIQRLTYNSGASVWPVSDTHSANYLYLAWNDNTPGNNEVFFKYGYY